MKGLFIKLVDAALVRLGIGPNPFWQFFRFCVVGGIVTAFDFAFYYGLTRAVGFFAVHYLAAATLSFCFAATLSFALNTFWTFRVGGRGWQRRAPRFFAIAVVGVGINASVIFLLVEAGLFDLLAKVASTGVVLMWNFTAQRKWTFRA
jgi:putative flippase GtrA